ncbi:sigma-54-dependent transcriptional regulator [Deferrisoma camini]|uniref:sigma-54-dependent transcriptional regulator n=1 Tax=Deferrisoma camini TaxID=1035120 RepID=UPI00046D8EC1|nr:sigma-54 dependent transcriptional regulator [Deferrisoma camini]
MDRAKILVVDDEEPLRRLLSKEFSRSGHLVETARNGEEGLARYREEIFNVVLLDIRMPGLDGVQTLKEMRRETTIPEIVILTGHGTIESAVECIKLGAYDYLTKPIKLAELELVVNKAHEKNRLRLQNINLRIEAERSTGHLLVGRSPAFLKTIELVERVANTMEPVLILGESGTGKEMVARALHAGSSRANRPFVAVNCGRLDVHTAESELFGHTAGAFTGATKNRVGAFELADGGTLFLDEVSEMPLDVQVKLLRVLETQTFRRLGGNRDIRVSVRLMFASNRNLEERVRSGLFREDLYYRINLFAVRLPPLRERLPDIEPLTHHFLRSIPPRKGGEWVVAPETLRAMEAYHWPGNVRELKNVVRRACILAERPLLTPDLLPFGTGPRPLSPSGRHGLSPLWVIERDHIRAVLESTNWNKSRAAEILGVDRKTLYAKIEKYALRGSPHL